MRACFAYAYLLFSIDGYDTDNHRPFRRDTVGCIVRALGTGTDIGHTAKESARLRLGRYGRGIDMVADHTLVGDVGRYGLCGMDSSRRGHCGGNAVPAAARQSDSAPAYQLVGAGGREDASGTFVDARAGRDAAQHTRGHGRGCRGGRSFGGRRVDNDDRCHGTVDGYGHTEYSRGCDNLAAASRRGQFAPTFVSLRCHVGHRGACGRRRDDTADRPDAAADALSAGIRRRRDALRRSGGAYSRGTTGAPLQRRDDRLRRGFHSDDDPRCGIRISTQ